MPKLSDLSDLNTRAARVVPISLKTGLLEPSQPLRIECNRISLTPQAAKKLLTLYQEGKGISNRQLKKLAPHIFYGDFRRSKK